MSSETTRDEDPRLWALLSILRNAKQAHVTALGHARGDLLLRRIADAFARTHFRDSDFEAREECQAIAASVWKET